MSKTQLQTNNSKLSTLITELQGKAAGGSGGGSVETCTITRNSTISIVGYIDTNGIAQILDNTTNTALSVECIKNSGVYAYDLNAINGISVSGGETLFESMYSDSWYGRATSDLTITN